MAEAQAVAVPQPPPSIRESTHLTRILAESPPLRYALASLLLVVFVFYGRLSLSLDWRDLLSVLSTLIAVYSIRETFSVKKALRSYRRRLHYQTGALYYRDISKKAELLSSLVVKQDWQELMSKTTTLVSEIGIAQGTWKLDSEQHANLASAATAIRTLMTAVPLTELGKEKVDIDEMRNQCMGLVFTIGNITGYLERLDKLEEEV